MYFDPDRAIMRILEINERHEREAMGFLRAIHGRLTLMSQELNDAVAALQAKVTEHDTEIQAAVTAILAKPSVSADPDVAAAVQALGDLSTKISGETAALANAIAPPPAPTAPASGGAVASTST